MDTLSTRMFILLYPEPTRSNFSWCSLILVKASSPEIQLQLRALSINLHWNTASNITHLSVNVSYLCGLDGAVVFEYDLEGQYRKKCTSVPPPARFGKTTGSHPKGPQNNLLYWSDCEDTNSWPQSWHRTNIQELKCLPPSPFTLYDTGYLDSFT